MQGALCPRREVGNRAHVVRLIAALEEDLYWGRWSHVSVRQPGVQPLCPALSLVSPFSELFCSSGSLGIDQHRWWPWRKTCTGAAGPTSVSVSPASSPWCAEAQALPGALVSCTERVSSSAQAGPLALTSIDSEPGGRLFLDPLAQANVHQPDARPRCTEAHALPGTLVSCTELCELFHPADSLALTGIDGGPGGGLVLGPLTPRQCLSARHPAPGVLKPRPFLVP
ncbi:uncharacterized protein LOC129014573 [Pongo pygmaeus]|uniref:uncharacterized protein LOC129014573 n=1 Tax=Pongo pygmaeus TaxID=9600 RepID=UPI00300C4EFF